MLSLSAPTRVKLHAICLRYLKALLLLCLLMQPAPHAGAQLKLPDIRLPKLPDLAGLFKEEAALSTSIKDVRGEVPYLDSYTPAGLKPLDTLTLGPNGGWLVQPGNYGGDIRSYCLHAGTYGPSRGNGYLYAPLKGKQSGLIRRILHNSALHTEIPQQEVQSLIWAIEARPKFDALSPNLQHVADVLVDQKDILDLKGLSLNSLTDQLKSQAMQRLSVFLRPVFEAENRLRQVLTDVTTSYQQLERIAVLQGDPPATPDSREVPGGRWSFHPDGFFVRYLPNSYSQTHLEIPVPETVDIQRDAQGRIHSVMDTHGHRIETDYNDTLAALTTPNGRVNGYLFSAIRIITADASSNDGVSIREYKETGWTYRGVPDQRMAIPDTTGYPGCDLRLKEAQELVRQMETLQKQLGKRKYGDMEDMIDIAHYRAAVEIALKASNASPKEPLDLLTRAWQSAMCTWAHPSELAIGRNSGPLLLPLSDLSACTLAGTEQIAIPSTPVVEFDPSRDVATPGNTCRQRLGLSTVCVHPSNAPRFDAQTDLTKILKDGNLNVCVRQTYGDQSHFWFEGPIQGGHKYFTLNSLGKSPKSAKETMDLLKSNFALLFPGGASSIDGLEMKLHRQFELAILPRLLIFSRFHVDVPARVKCQEETDTTFLLHAIPGEHILQGDALHGVFKDACGELWMFQQGSGPADESSIRAAVNYIGADIMWWMMANRFRQRCCEATASTDSPILRGG